jgi:BlaI family transcriptional regulator, penicillinase repressor
VTTLYGSKNTANSSARSRVARRANKVLTDRQIELMHAYWKCGELTAGEACRELAKLGHDLAYVTVANLTRTLVEKQCLELVNDRRPFRYRPARTFDEVSSQLVGDFVERVFQGSIERMLVILFGCRRKLSASERAFVARIVKEQSQLRS